MEALYSLAYDVVNQAYMQRMFSTNVLQNISIKHYGLTACVWCKSSAGPFNALMARKMATISQTKCFNSFSWINYILINISLDFRWGPIGNKTALIEIIKQATSNYLKQWWLIHRHIYVSLNTKESSQGLLTVKYIITMQWFLPHSIRTAVFLHQWTCHSTT